MKEKLSGKEMYVGILLLFISTIILIAQVFENLSPGSDAIRSENNSLVLNTNDILDTIHTYVLALIGLIGGIQWLRKKHIGWIFSTAMYVYYFGIAVYALIVLVDDRQYDVGFILVSIPTILLLLATVFLFLKPTLQKFRVSKKTILPTLLIFMAILAVTFFKR